MARKWGQWLNIEQLSKGGQGTTFKVRKADEPNGEVFVLKRLDNNKRIARFEKEITALGRLRHPNIIRLVDHGVQGDESYYVTEYCHHGTLEDLDLSGMSTLQRLDLFLKICEAIGVVHHGSVWIVHRDIKPANIFLNETVPIVGDFGLCFSGAQDTRLTATDEAAGPRLYMAPELEDGRSDDVHPAADVYSLGKLLYWMFAGRVFAREKHREPEWNLVRDHPREPDLYFVNGLLDQAVVHDPSKRIQFAFDLAREVKQVMEILSHDGHHLDVDSPQICGYCRVGCYRVQLDEWAHGGAGQQAIHQYGLRPQLSRWLILCCDHCGNLQMFRPDLAGGGSKWQGLKSPAEFPGR
jgi:serine/threonine protein kinase